MAKKKNALGPNPGPGGAGEYETLDPAVNQEKLDPYSQIGVSGLQRQTHGHTSIDEEFLKELKGVNGVKAYREISDNNAVIGAVLFLIDSFVRKVDWIVDPAEDAPEGEKWATFMEQNMEDLAQSWPDLMGEIVRGICV